MMVTGYMPKEMEDAVWNGDTERLHEMAPCKCCCHEHTYERCPARLWGGCRSSMSYEQETREMESWVRHYRSAHNMSRSEFFGHLNVNAA